MPTVNAFIGCRLGSTRVKLKNLSLIDNKPLFSYLTDNALKTSNINNLYLNTDSQHIVDIASGIYKERLKYYIRPSHLGSSKAKLDDFEKELAQRAVPPKAGRCSDHIFYFSNFILTKSLHLEIFRCLNAILLIGLILF